MQIHSISSSRYQNNNTKDNLDDNPNFKAGYPVRVFVKEAEGKYAEVRGTDLARKLVSKFVKYLDGSLKQNVKDNKALTDFARRIVSASDVDFSRNMKAAGFINSNRKDGEELAYIVTGNDTQTLKNYGEKIGYADKHYGKNSAEANIARGDYHIIGLNFIKKLHNRFKDNSGKHYGLNIGFEAVRKKSTGEINSYTLKDIKYTEV